MTHTIENNKNSLANLLVKVQDQASRNADYLAPLKRFAKNHHRNRQAANRCRAIRRGSNAVFRY